MNISVLDRFLKYVSVGSQSDADPRSVPSTPGQTELARLLNISDNQLGYVTNVPAGCGLIRCAGNIVPFTNSFPKDTKLYKLMSTNPSERKE